jgi:hypothetical protein
MDGTTSSETQGVDKFPNTNLPKSVNPSVDVVILVFIVVFVILGSKLLVSFTNMDDSSFNRERNWNESKADS